MSYLLSLRVETDLEPEQARDKVVQLLEEEGVQVLSQSVAVDGEDHDFLVSGVDLSTQEPFSQSVSAPSAEAAAEQVASDTRVVAHVLEVAPEPEEEEASDDDDQLPIQSEEEPTQEEGG